jgi:hypothetical protein
VQGVTGFTGPAGTALSVGATYAVYYSNGVINQFSTNPIVTTVSALTTVNVGSSLVGAAVIFFTPTTTTPTIQQQATLSGNGQNFILAAQSSSAAASTGGNLILDAGSGVSTDGSVVLRSPNTVYATFSPTLFTTSLSYGSNILFTPTLSTPTIQQQATLSGNGQNLLLSAQSSSALTSTGGNLILDAGSGTSTDGSVILRSPNTIYATFGPTTFDLNIPFTFGSTVASPTINQIAPSSGGGNSLTIQAQSAAATGGGGGQLLLFSGPGTGGGSSGDIFLQTANSTTLGIVHIGAVGYVGVEVNMNTPVMTTFYTPNIVFASTVTSPLIYQAAGAGAGNSLSIIAQAGASGQIGGSLGLRGGAGGGTGAGGSLTLYGGNHGVGGTIRGDVYIGSVGYGAGFLISTTNNQVTQYLSNLSFDFNVTSPTISQATTVSAANGQNLTIQAQSATTVGGSLILLTGTGGTSGGNLTLSTGVGSTVNNSGVISISPGGSLIAQFLRGRGLWLTGGDGQTLGLHFDSSPTDPPTTIGGGCLYHSVDGHLKWRDAGGTVTIIV